MRLILFCEAAADHRTVSALVDRVFGEEGPRLVKQAREEASSWAPFPIVLGCPDRTREAWVLAGFEPESDEERSRLKEEQQALGFCPCHEAHRLGDKDEGARRNPKRVVRKLTNKDKDREARCSTDAPLARLRQRGEATGLRAFLDEVKEHIVPLCDGPSPKP